MKEKMFLGIALIAILVIALVIVEMLFMHKLRASLRKYLKELSH